MKDLELISIKEKYGSPTFVFNIDELKKRIGEIKEILKSANKDKKINLCYSIKANPFLVPEIVDDVDMFEVCSPGELEIVKHYGVAPGKIIYSGVNKGYKDVNDAIEYGVAVVTVESLLHFEILKETAKKKGVNVSVILRLTSGNQFGMSEEDIRSILESMPYENLSIDGMHYFAGTQRNNPKPQEKEMNKICELVKNIREEYNIPFEKIEYGPGLNYPYFTKDDFSDTLRPLKNIVNILGEAAEYSEFTVEMGRFIASECGYYIAGIADIKSSNGQRWIILDGGLNHINYYGQMMGMKCPIIRHIKSNEVVCESNSNNANDTYTLCGSLCTANDILVREINLCDAKIGDILVFENLGAYSVTEGINLFLSRDMAKVILYSEGKEKIVRQTINTWKLNCMG